MQTLSLPNSRLEDGFPALLLPSSLKTPQIPLKRSTTIRIPWPKRTVFGKSPALTGFRPSQISSGRSGASNLITCRIGAPQIPKIGKYSGQERVDILAEALPFIQKFHGKTVVVKYGGAAMKNEDLKDRVIKDLVLLSCVGMRPIFVHGGGPEINEWLGRIGIKPQFKDGLRVTDAATMEVVEMVLVGKVNKSLVSLINRAGGNAVGLCGKDGNLITARPAWGDLGFVGEVSSINTTVLKAIVENGSIPVIASVAADGSGQAYNINADTVAGEIAASLSAEKLILLTDVTGLLLDKDKPESLVKQVDIKGVKKLVEEGIVSGGMIPKVNCCVRSIAQGVRTASIIDGRLPHSLLFEILTDEGAGTMIIG